MIGQRTESRKLCAGKSEMLTSVGLDQIQKSWSPIIMARIM